MFFFLHLRMENFDMSPTLISLSPYFFLHNQKREKYILLIFSPIFSRNKLRDSVLF